MTSLIFISFKHFTQTGVPQARMNLQWVKLREKPAYRGRIEEFFFFFKWTRIKATEDGDSRAFTFLMIVIFREARMRKWVPLSRSARKVTWSKSGDLQSGTSRSICGLHCRIKTLPQHVVMGDRLYFFFYFCKMFFFPYFYYCLLHF